MPQGYVFSPDQISAMASYFNAKSRANANLGAAKTSQPGPSLAVGGVAPGQPAIAGGANATPKPATWSWLDLLSPLAAGIEGIGTATNAVWNSIENGKPWWESVGTGIAGFSLGVTDAVARAVNADEPLLDAAHNWNPELTGKNPRAATYLSTAIGEHTDGFKFIDNWVHSWAPDRVGKIDPIFSSPATPGGPSDPSRTPAPVAAGFEDRMSEASKGVFSIGVDVLADPTTYISFGVGPSLRGASAGVRAATEAGAKAAAETGSVMQAIKASSAAFKPAWQAARDAADAIRANQRAARDAARVDTVEQARPATTGPAATATDRNAMAPAMTLEGEELDMLLAHGYADSLRQQADDFASLGENAAVPGALGMTDIAAGVERQTGRMLDNVARGDAAASRADDMLGGLEDIRRTVGAAERVPSEKILRASRQTGKLSAETQSAMRDALYSGRPGQAQAAIAAIEKADPAAGKILDTDISGAVGSATPITVREAIEQVRPRRGAEGREEFTDAHAALADAVEAALTVGGKSTGLSTDALREAILAAVPGAKRITQAKLDRIVMAKNNNERLGMLNGLLSPFMGQKLTYKSVGAMMRGLMVDSAAEAEAMRRTLKTLGFYREATAKDVSKLRDSIINKANPRYDELVRAVESREEILVQYGIDNETYQAALALTRTPDGQQMIADYRAIEARLAAGEREALVSARQAVREQQQAAGAAVKPGQTIKVSAPKGIKVKATENGGVTTGTSTAPGREVQDIQGVVASDVYEAMQHAPNSGPVRKSYAALEQTILEQYRQMKADGLTLEFRQGVEGPNPYPDSASVMRDIDENRNLVVQADSGATLAADHPLNKMVEVDGEQIHLNDLFRGVHDYWGHYKAGEAGRVVSFGPTGEYDAWLTHRETLPEGSWMALWDETRGQNTWTNYYGDHSAMPIADRPFAEQKAGVVPREVYAADPDEFAAGVPTAQRRQATPKATLAAPTGRAPGALPAAQRVANVAADQEAGRALLGGYGAPDATGRVAIGAGTKNARDVSPHGAAFEAAASALGKDLRAAQDDAIKAGRGEQDYFGYVLQGNRLASIANRSIAGLRDLGPANTLSGVERAAFLANHYRAVVHGVEDWMRRMGIFPAQPSKTGPLFAVSWGQMVSAMSDAALKPLLGLAGQFGAKVDRGAEAFTQGFSIFPNAIYPAVQDALGMLRRNATVEEIAVAAEARMRTVMRGVRAEAKVPEEDWKIMAREISDPEFLRAIDEIDQGQLGALAREHYEAGRAAVLPVMASMREIVRVGGAGDAKLFEVFTHGYDEAIKTTLGDAGVPTLASKIAAQAMDAAFLKGFLSPRDVADFGARKSISDLFGKLAQREISEASRGDVAAMAAFVAGRKQRFYDYRQWRDGVTAALAKHYEATADDAANSVAREAMDHAEMYEAQVAKMAEEGVTPPTTLPEELAETYVNLTTAFRVQNIGGSKIVAGLGQATMNLMVKLDPFAYQSSIRDVATGAKMYSHTLMQDFDRGFGALIGGTKEYQGVRGALSRQLGHTASKDEINDFIRQSMTAGAYLRWIYPKGVSDDFFAAFAEGKLPFKPGPMAQMDEAGGFAEFATVQIDPAMIPHAININRFISNFAEPAVIRQMGITQQDIAMAAKRTGLDPAFATSDEALDARSAVWMKWLSADDPIETVTRYYRAVAEASVRPRVAGELAAIFGDTSKRGGDWVRVDAESGSLAAHLGATWFPPEIGEQLPFLQRFLDDMDKAPSGAWGRSVMPVIDFLTNMYRSSLTIWNPRHHVANIIGEVAINAIHGVNPGRSIMANRILAEIGHANKEMVDEFIGKLKPESELGVIDEAMLGPTLTATIGGKRVEIPTRELMQMAQEDGIIMSGQIERQVEDLMVDSRVAKALNGFTNNKYNLIARANRSLSRVSAWRDNQTRIAHWLEEMSRGGENMLKARNRAREIVHRTHPTPASLAAFEYKTIRRLFTFYTWQKMLAGEVLRLALERPGVVMVPMKFGYARAQANGITPLSYTEPFPADPEERERIAGYYMNGAYGPQVTGGDMPDLLGILFGYSSDPTPGELSNLWGMSLNAPQLDSLSGVFQNIDISADPFSALAAPIAAANPLLKQIIESTMNKQAVGSSQPIRGVDDPVGDQMGYMFSQTGVPFAMAYMAGWEGTKFTDVNKDYDTPTLIQGELLRRSLNWWTGLKITNYTNPTSTKIATQDASHQTTIDLRGLGYSDDQISDIKRYYSAYTKAGNKIDIQSYLDQIGFAPPAGR